DDMARRRDRGRAGLALRRLGRVAPVVRARPRSVRARLDGRHRRRRHGRGRPARVGYNSGPPMTPDPAHVESPVIVARDGSVATITVNRPAVRNALNDATLGAIDAAVAALDADPEVRVILLTGAGDKAFIAGADINELSRATA